MALAYQPGILEPVPAAGRYLTLRLRHGADPAARSRRWRGARWARGP